MAEMEFETWDQDFEGGFNAFAGNSVGTVQTSISSRLSIHSESIAGADEDWDVLIDANDAPSQAVKTIQQAGVPLPSNVPASALLGGTIKRLGKQKSRPKLIDDWDNDIEMPDSGALHLKPRKIDPPTAAVEEYDDFDELEGSLGIRFAGRDAVRSSSVSAMSPSLGSVTAESDDELRGLELPEGSMDFEAILMKKRRAAEAELSDLSQPSPALEQAPTMNVHKKSKLVADDNDDYMNDFDLGTGGTIDTRKRTINKNIRIKNDKPSPATQRAALTINFHENKPLEKPLRSHIPRPVSGSKPAASRLEPVFETGASSVVPGRRQPTTTGTQLLRSKRSMPALRSQQPTASSMSRQAPALPPGGFGNQVQAGSSHRPSYLRSRGDSDPRRGAQSPPLRPHSRLSILQTPDTPSRGARQRQDVAPTSLAREAAAKRTMTKPSRRKNFGDGNELEIFDDLPTSTAKESRFVKQPVLRAPGPRPVLRQMQSRGDMRDQVKRLSGIPDRMVTPAPPRTPASPTKNFYEPPSNTPSYLRDTAASRIARESKTANNSRPRSDGPLMPMTTNWKAQVAARSPNTSPSAQRQKPKRAQPQLIKGIGAHVAKTEKGMSYNPQTLRWEGNENTLQHFDLPPPLDTPTPTGHTRHSYMERQIQSSPPRPALIAPMSNTAMQGIQVNGSMVFDPRRMKWLKLKDHPNRDVSGPLSPSVTDAEEEDAFAGIEDLKDDFSPAVPAVRGASMGMASPVSVAAAGAGEIHEEFDLGPRFIETQTAEEAMWRRRCANWFVHGEERIDDGAWKWGIRELVRAESSWDL